MILYLYLMNTVYFNLRAEYHEKIRTPPADAIKDCLRVPGTFLFHNKSLRREIGSHFVRLLIGPV